MKGFKVKRVRKKNVSDVRIYSSNSELVLSENKKREVKCEGKSKRVKKELTELERKNQIYRDTIRQIQSLCFKGIITSTQFKVLNKLVQKKYRKKQLHKHTYQSLLRDIRGVKINKLQKMINS